MTDTNANLDTQAVWTVVGTDDGNQANYTFTVPSHGGTFEEDTIVEIAGMFYLDKETANAWETALVRIYNNTGAYTVQQNAGFAYHFGGGTPRAAGSTIYVVSFERYVAGAANQTFTFDYYVWCVANLLRLAGSTWSVKLYRD